MHKFTKSEWLKTIIAMSRWFFLVCVTTCTFTGVLVAHEGKSQQRLSAFKVTLKAENARLSDVFEKIEGQTDFKFSYLDELVLNLRVSVVASNKPLDRVLERIARVTKVTFKRVNNMIAVSRIKESHPEVPVSDVGETDFIITGKLTNEGGEPLPGANVFVKGTGIGTTTDVDGNYRLNVPADATTLVFSFIGYLTEEVEIASRSVIDMVMLPDIRSLQEVEVVSTGYYEVEQRFNPGNIVKVDAKTIEQQPISNPLQALQGRLTGVNITQKSGVPGSGFEIRIRGQNSLRDGPGVMVPGNDPLYIINGVPYPSQSLSFNGTGMNPGLINPLNFINPNDIESIEILKDADATAIYGTRGANGVVRITTKKGKKGRLDVTYTGQVGFGTLENKLDVLNTEQYLEMRREALRNDGVEPSDTDFDVNGIWSEDRSTNWQEELLGGSSNFSNHQLSFSGGSENTSFLLGLNYLKETILFSDDFFDQKFSTNLNLNHTSTDGKFQMDFSGNFLANNNQLFSNNFAFTAVTLAPNAPALFDENGDLNWEEGTFNNPMAQMFRESETQSLNWTGNINVSYEIIDGLRIKSLLGYSQLQSDETAINPIASINPFLPTEPFGMSRFSNNSVNTWIVEPKLEYGRQIDEHEFVVLIGTTFQETTTDRELVRATGYTSDALLRNPLAGQDAQVIEFVNSEYRFNSIYGRINYIYDEKYILNLTGRRDGSSRFGPGDRFADFGAVGAGWIFSEEDFIKDNIAFLSYGKIRGSYGLTGSDAIGDYQFLDLWVPTELGYNGIQGLAPQNLPNAVFAWEETTKAEVGLELGFLEDRIRVNTSYFQNNSSNQLVGQPLPSIAGFNTIQANFPAEVQNTGWEFDVNSINISSGNFQWSTNFNISILRNELVSFDNIEGTSFANRFTVGEPLSIFNVLSYIGVDPETGIATFQDLNEDDRIALQDDGLPLVDLEPEFFGGIQNRISYKGISLDFLFRFVKQEGRSINAGFIVPGEASNQPVNVMNRWQSPGDNAAFPRFTQASVARTANGNLRSSNGFVEDASFIRLQNVSLSYQFPSSMINSYSLEALRLFVQGQNLLTITSYTGWDPETQSVALPPLRILTAGITVTF